MGEAEQGNVCKSLDKKGGTMILGLALMSAGFAITVIFNQAYPATIIGTVFGVVGLIMFANELDVWIKSRGE